MKLAVFLSVIVSAMLGIGPAIADYLEVSRQAIIRMQPERNSNIVQRVPAGTTLQLLNDGETRNGYYHVRGSETRRTGWIYRNRVRRRRGPLPVAVAPPPPPDPFNEVHSALCLFGCPSGGPATNDLVLRDIYILSNNQQTKLADWVAYRVSTETIGPSKSRNWKPDPALDPATTMEPQDYDDAHKQLGVDRGHQAPLASFSGTEHWRTTNYLSNITPQKSGLNQGPWNRLEDRVRKLAAETGVKEVFVMTGPLFERAMPPLPKTDKEHKVPSSYWKVIAIRVGGSADAIAFYFDQDAARDAELCEHVRTVDDIERLSGLDFLYVLDDEVESAIEATSSRLAAKLGCPT